MKIKAGLLFSLLLSIFLITVIGTVSVLADATDEITPFYLIDGDDIELSAFFGADNREVSYDSTTGITTLKITSDYTVTNSDATCFKIMLDGVNVKSAPYIALGAAYSTGNSMNSAIELANPQNRLWARTFAYSTEISKVVFDAPGYTLGQNGGYDTVTDTSTYDHFRLLSGYSNGQVIPTGTTFSVQYVAFFDNLDDANAYVYTPPKSVKPVAIADGEMLTASTLKGFKCESVAKSESDPAHIHFTVDSSTASSAWDNIRAIAKINNDVYPAGFSLATSDVLKIAYRTNSAQIGSQPETIYTSGARIWGGLNGITLTGDGEWHDMVIDLSEVAYTGGYGGDYTTPTTDVAANTWAYIQKNIMSAVQFKPFTQSAMTSDNGSLYFDVLYIAFFNSVEDANAHVYTETPKSEVDITLDKHAFRMLPGEKLTVSVTAENGASVIYESDSDAVTVDQNGVITAVKAGSATVTATATLDGLTGYDQIKLYVNEKAIAPLEITKKAHADSVESLPKLAFMGDSITAPNQAHHYFLEQDLHITRVNLGLSGSNIGGVGSSGQISFIDRVNLIPTDTDLVFVLGGINDFGHSTGSLARFETGVRTLIEKLIIRFPDKQIVFSTPLQNGGYFPTGENSRGETLEQYVKEMEEACGEYGIHVIKSWRDETFKDFCLYDEDGNITGYNTTYYKDGVHLNEAGYVILADFFEEQLESVGAVKYSVASDIVYGDVNGDGEINSEDSVIMARVLAQWSGYEMTADEEDAVDVNSDTSFDSTDLVIVSRYLAQWSGYEVLPLTASEQ
ncbi:MAG: Ig-like domain-containing protein [Clostridia bacterium]|nr:Ig-like domain-containing protein [Clostridia bacterium]